MTPHNLKTTLETLTPTLIAKLKALGALGEELEQRPDGVDDTYVLGVLASAPPLMRDVETIERMLQLMVREAY
jgi:hypothetical protein